MAQHDYVRMITPDYLIKDYKKPMGVATFRTKEDMPEKFRNALPDIEELKKLL